MNRSSYDLLDAAASLHIPDNLDLFPAVKAQLNQRRTFMQTLRARPALAILLAVLALLLLTGVAYAISRSLGYLPGIGFVEQGTKIRVLAEPVSQTREGVTVTIEQVVVDSERTVVIYKAEGLSLQAANSQGEGASGHYPNLIRLPDGTVLEESPSTGYEGIPEPLLNNVQTEAGWPSYVRRLVYPSIDLQVDELTLVLPGLENMPSGTAPEKWEIPFHLKPAPPDMTVVPITMLAPQSEPVTANPPVAQTTSPEALSNVSRRNGVTLSLDNVIEVGDGFVFTGKLMWDDSTFPPNTSILFLNLPALLTLSDGNGQKVPIEEVPLNGISHSQHEQLWSFRTNRKSFTGPLVFSIASIETTYMTEPFEIDLDLGSHPQIGQTWELNREFKVGDHTFRVLSAQLVPTNTSGSCLLFDIENVESTVIQDLNPAPVDARCYDPNDRAYGGIGYNGNPANVYTQPVGYQNVPSGVHRFALNAVIPYSLAGPWQVTWNPPASSEPPPTAPVGACLTYDKWQQVIGQNDAVPAGLAGKVLLTIDDPNSGANFPTLQLANLDGSDLRTVVYGGWPTLSSDGARLGYVDQNGLNSLDLTTGQISTLSSDGYRMIWSHDDTRIMYTNTFHLFVANADGTDVQTIDTGAAQVIAPVGWLPDDQTLLYSAMGGEGFNLRSYNLQSGETKDLFVIHNKAGFATVSPDGQWIAFADREFGAYSWTIFLARLDGSDRRRVTDSDVPTPFNMVWGPDGQWLFINTYVSDASHVPVLVNPFTCQALHVNTINGAVEDWKP